MNTITDKQNIKKERQAYNYACRILSRKDYTIHEIRMKLKKKEYQNKIIEKIIQQFIKLNFLNDKNYIERYIRTRLNLNPRSTALLKLELQRKGIPTNLIDEVFNNVAIDDLTTAKKLIYLKQTQLNKLTDEKKQNKILNLLKARGFSYGVIVKIIDHYL